jgi:hypothetical protein
VLSIPIKLPTRSLQWLRQHIRPVKKPALANQTFKYNGACYTASQSTTAGKD